MRLIAALCLIWLLAVPGSQAAPTHSEDTANTLSPPERDRAFLLWHTDNEDGGPGWTHGDNTATAMAHFHVDTYYAWSGGTYSVLVRRAEPGLHRRRRLRQRLGRAAPPAARGPDEPAVLVPGPDVQVQTRLRARLRLHLRPGREPGQLRRPQQRIRRFERGVAGHRRLRFRARRLRQPARCALPLHLGRGILGRGCGLRLRRGSLPRRRHQDLRLLQRTRLLLRRRRGRGRPVHRRPSAVRRATSGIWSRSGARPPRTRTAGGAATTPTRRSFRLGWTTG